MKKDTIIGSVVILAAIVGLAVYALLNPMPAQAPTTIAPVDLPPGAYVESTQYYDIETYYATSTPLLASAGAAADATAVALMRSFVNDTIEQFKRDGNFANLTEEDIRMMGYDQGRKQSLKIPYLIVLAPDTFAYVYTVYIDTLGAHGNMYFRMFNFNTSTGDYLSLSDLFLPRSPYLETLSSKSRELLPSVIGEAADARMITDGTKPEEANFANFFLENTSLVLVFPPYQVAAYAAGPQTLRIPLSDLASILKPEYR